MLTHEEKLTLVRDFIDAGETNPVIITESIKHLDKKLFMKGKKNIFTTSNSRADSPITTANDDKSNGSYALNKE
ncbi:hypothetical protein [Acinetobacter sp. ANC 5502]